MSAPDICLLFFLPNVKILGISDSLLVSGRNLDMALSLHITWCLLYQNSSPFYFSLLTHEGSIALVPRVGLSLFIHTTVSISVLIVLLGSYLLVSALFVTYIAKVKTVLLNSPFKAFLRFWHCKSFSLGEEGGGRYSTCLQTFKSLLLVCLSNGPKIWGVDGYCCCFAL